MTTLYEQTLAQIVPVDEQARQAAAARQLQLTKPAGALGELETIGNQLAAIARSCPPPVPEVGLVCVFAGDHGVHAQGISPWPQQVTQQMAANIAQGGAGVNVIARAARATVRVHDVGMLEEVDGVLEERVAAGTQDFTKGPAMTREQAMAAVEVGIRAAQQGVADGFQVLVPGEVGIGNTTPAAALISVFTGLDPALTTGRGAGAPDEMLAHKITTVATGIAVNRAEADDPIGALAAVGGFEHAAIVGLLLGAAHEQVPVVLDGAIACSAALVAVAVCPAVQGSLIAGHEGAEPGIRAACEHLGLHPTISLGLRLGEGTGGALALPVVATSARILAEMATFASAGVTEEHVE